MFPLQAEGLLERIIGYKIIVKGTFSRNELSIRDTSERMQRIGEIDKKIWNSNIEIYHDLARLKGWRIDDSKRVEISLGRTDYREYVLTRNSLIAGSHSQQELSNPLALCSMILTHDRRLVMIRRSAVVEAYSGFVHAPASGFIKLPRDVGLKGAPDPFLALDNEARDELGGDLKLREVICLGIAYDARLCHPELLFQARTSMTYQQLCDLKAKHTSPTSEIEALIDLQPEGNSVMNFMLDNFKVFVPTGFACAQRWGEERFGVEWLTELESALRTKADARRN